MGLEGSEIYFGINLIVYIFNLEIDLGPHETKEAGRHAGCTVGAIMDSGRERG